jgi:hypothetical protein
VETSNNPVGGTVCGQGGHNFQSAYPGGATEQRRLRDCELLVKHFEKVFGWRSISRLANELNWSRRRVRDAIRAMRGSVDHERCIGDHGAIEDRWCIRTNDEWRSSR